MRNEMTLLFWILYGGIIAELKTVPSQAANSQRKEPCTSKHPCFDRSFPTQITSDEGDLVIFHCAVIGLTSPTITWYGPPYNDMPLVVGDNVFLNDHESRKSVELNSSRNYVMSKLIIDFVKSEDSGLYKCTVNGIANNSLNYDFRVIALNERLNSERNYNKDRMILLQAPKFVRLGGTAVLICKALANSLYQDTFSVDWYRLNYPIVSDLPRIQITKSFETHSSSQQSESYEAPLTELVINLTIHNVSYWLDTGRYTCKTSRIEKYSKIIVNERIYDLIVRLRYRDSQLLTTPPPTTLIPEVEQSEPMEEVNEMNKLLPSFQKQKLETQQRQNDESEELHIKLSKSIQGKKSGLDDANRRGATQGGISDASQSGVPNRALSIFYRFDVPNLSWRMLIILLTYHVIATLYACIAV